MHEEIATALGNRRFVSKMILFEHGHLFVILHPVFFLSAIQGQQLKNCLVFVLYWLVILLVTVDSSS